MENVRLVKELYQAFGAGDNDRFVAGLHPDIVWGEAAGFPGVGGRHVGVEAVLSVLASLPRDWEAMTFDVERVLADDEVVVVLGETGATCRATGRSYACPFAHVWHLHDGLVTSWRAHLDTALARAAIEPVG